MRMVCCEFPRCSVLFVRLSCESLSVVLNRMSVLGDVPLCLRCSPSIAMLVLVNSS